MYPSPPDEDDPLSGKKSDVTGKAVREVPILTNILDDVLQTLFKVDANQLKKMMDAISNALNKLLRQRSSDGLALRWSYVPMLPVARPTGKCLALDFGCSNNFFAVNLCQFMDDSDTAFKLCDRRTFMLTGAVRRVHMSKFCDFVAACVRKVLLDNNVHSSSENPIDMGISAGFDVRVKAQQNPASATVISSSKDYSMAGFIGQDFVPQFHAAFQRANIQVQIVTVVNDAVSVLLAGIHQANSGNSREPGKDCSIGVVCHRSGCNMAFLETDRDFMDTCGSDGQHLLLQPRGNGYCAMANTEAGYWIGAQGELDDFANKVEQVVKKRFNNGAGIRLEYLMSGAWYPMTLSQSLHLLKSIKILAMSVEESWSPGQSACFEIFTHCDRWRSGPDWPHETKQLAAKLRPLLGVKKLDSTDALIIADVCQAIVSRTAEVLAAAILAVAKRAYGRAFPKKLVVAYDGSLFTSVSQLRQLLEASLRQLMLDDFEVSLEKVDVGFGCAVTALSAGNMMESRAQA